MKPIAFLPVLAFGLALFVAAGTIQTKVGVPAIACELTGLALFSLGFSLMVVALYRSLIARTRLIVVPLYRSFVAQIRRVIAPRRLVKTLETQLGQLQTEHSQAIQDLANRHSAEVENMRRESREETEKLRAEITQLGQELRPKLPERASALASVWVTRKGPKPKPTFMHRDDPIYGQLAIHKELFPLLCHPLFQRLNYVRQLSFAYLTFPSASHTRLSHLFGVTKNAQEVLRKIVTRNRAYVPRGEDPNTRQLILEPDLIPLDLDPRQVEEVLLKAQLCALLHDVGHGPFGHALDKLIPYLGHVDSSEPPDIVYSRKYIEGYLSDDICAAGFRPDNIAAILDKDRRGELSGFDVLIADLVASAVDIDRMDYLVRDAHMTGLQMGYVNTEALREQMYPLEQNGDYKLVYAPAALTEMEDLAQAHHNMYVHCYEHMRKLAAERLLMRAVEHLVVNGLGKDDLMLLSDDQLFALLSEFLAPGTAEGGGFRALRENIHFTPAAEYRLSRWNPKSEALEFNTELSSTAKAWFDLWGSGKRFLQKVYIEEPSSWEKQICGAIGLREEDRWKVIVTVPAFDAKLRKESGAWLVSRRPSGELFLEDFQNVSPTLKNILTILDPERHVVRVLVAEDLRPEIAKFREVADDLFRRKPESAA